MGSRQQATFYRGKESEPMLIDKNPKNLEVNFKAAADVLIIVVGKC
jgi:hypothetical protein